MRLLATALTLLALAGIAGADYQNGFLNADGYTYRDGLWYYPGYDYGYSRTWVSTPGYWYCGVYYAGSGYWNYVKVPNAAQVTSATPNWRSQLLEIAAARDRFEGEVRKSAWEHAQFIDSVKALGLTGNFQWSGYGTVPPYLVPGAAGGYGASYGANYGLNGHLYSTTSYGANANTLYGYSTLANLYGSNDLNALFQQASQLAQGSQRLTSEAVGGFQGLVGQEGNNRARVAEIISRGQMAAQIISSLQTAPVTETKGLSFAVSPNGVLTKQDDGTGDPGVRKGLRERFEALVGAKCASCHSGAKTAGGVDMAGYLTFDAKKKQRVWERIAMDPSSPDYPSKMMPRDPADPSKPGTPLTKEEQKLFFLN